MDHKKKFDEYGRAIKPVPEWLFGQPSLASANNGRAGWIRGGTSPLDQKGSTGWLAELYGGVQTAWNDWARLSVPVNELPLTDLNECMWSYYMTETEAFGINTVIFVHDPTDFDKRAELTQQADIATLEKASGWNAHELNRTTDQFYFYGEGTTGTSLTAGPPNYYGIDDFAADALFKNWVIYRITFDNGWHTGSNEFKSAYVADVKINDTMVPLGPVNGKHRKTVVMSKTLEAEGAYEADDVISESDTNGSGTDWDFDFGGTGYIVKAVVAHATTAIEPRIDIQCYSQPPTCELDDHAAATGPITADIPYFLGVIEVMALKDAGTSHSYAVVTTSTVGGLPIEFDVPVVYAVTVTRTATDFADDTLLTIALTAEMED